MTDHGPAVPNTRSPGTPVCHPNDANLLSTNKEASSVSIRRPLASVPQDSEYVELHAASAFSFLAGASQPEELIEHSAGLGMPAMALTDRNGL